MKYEAGQMWVKGDKWIVVIYAASGWHNIVSSEQPFKEWPPFASKEMDRVLKGYTLTNPRGLREAAENAHVTWRMATDSESAEVCKAMDALRAALEGGAE